jgi:hypothetical protein
MFLALFLAGAAVLSRAPETKPVAEENTVEEVVVTPSSEKPLKLNLDPLRRFEAPEYPYLRQQPVNGCKPMAGGATHKLGKAGVASGIVCVKRF